MGRWAPCGQGGACSLSGPTPVHWLVRAHLGEACSRQVLVEVSFSFWTNHISAAFSALSVMLWMAVPVGGHIGSEHLAASDRLPSVVLKETGEGWKGP